MPRCEEDCAQQHHGHKTVEFSPSISFSVLCVDFVQDFFLVSFLFALAVIAIVGMQCTVGQPPTVMLLV